MSREEIKKKYEKEVNAISAANKVDTGVALDMFLHNCKVITAAAAAAGHDWYKGGSLDELMKDYRAYVNQLPKGGK